MARKEKLDIRDYTNISWERPALYANEIHITVEETGRLHVKPSEMVDGTAAYRKAQKPKSIILRCLITCSSGAMRFSNLLMFDSGK